MRHNPRCLQTENPSPERTATDFDTLDASRKQVGAEGMPAFEAQVSALYDQMVRIDVKPHWAKLIDFETTLPTAVERMVRQRRSDHPN